MPRMTTVLVFTSFMVWLDAWCLYNCMDSSRWWNAQITQEGTSEHNEYTVAITTLLGTYQEKYQEYAFLNSWHHHMHNHHLVNVNNFTWHLNGLQRLFHSFCVVLPNVYLNPCLCMSPVLNTNKYGTCVCMRLQFQFLISIP